MEAVDHFAGVRTETIGYEKRGGQSRSRDPETDGHLLYGARN